MELTDSDISFCTVAVHAWISAPLEVRLKSSQKVAPATTALLPALDGMTG